MGGLWLGPRDLEGDQEMVAGEAGRGQVMQGLGSHTKNSGFYPEGKGSGQGKDRPRLVFQKRKLCCVRNTPQGAEEAGTNKAVKAQC